MSHRKGGSERLKESQLKRKAEKSVLEETPKIETLFGASTSRPSPSTWNEPGSSSHGVPAGASVEVAASAEQFPPSINIQPMTEDTTEVSDIFSSDPGQWTSITSDLREFWINKGPDDCRNDDADFRESRREYAGQARYLSKSFFDRTMPNNEFVKRDWLVYSPRTKSVYCFYCRLLSSDRENLFTGPGFNDWKKPERLGGHENNDNHHKALLDYLSRRHKCSLITTSFDKQCEGQREYWSNVLQRAMSVVSFLCERGLALRGSDETIGSVNNGNFLGILELLAKYDPFIAQHISSYASKGRGHVNYLSKTIYEELILIMGQKVLRAIVEEIHQARYFCVCVDSTPDVSHVDQLTVTIRYVAKSASSPTDRFLTFLPIFSHTGASLAGKLLQFLGDNHVNFKFCRGQTYDNASNMSGKYNGMQALLREQNPLADYIPCAAHSLNLVGHASVDCCVDVVSFFGFVQQLYNFFSQSTHRWKIMSDKLGGGNVPKSLSHTRWSAHADATSALLENYASFGEALEQIADDVEQKSESCHEACSLLDCMTALETGILCSLWAAILEQFNRCSKSLQASDVDLSTAVSLLDGLKVFLQEIRSAFPDYEQKRKLLSKCETYKSQRARHRKRKAHFSEGTAPDAAEAMGPAESFRINTFNAMIDHLVSALDQRSRAYSTIYNRFRVLTCYNSMSGEDILKDCSELLQTYSGDLDASFLAEFQQFARFILQAGEDVELPTGCNRAEQVYHFLISSGAQSAFPNCEIVYRIYLSRKVTNCSGERSFSQLKRIKSELRSTMGQDRLSALSLMCIEASVLRQIDFKDIINNFATKKARKRLVN